MPPRAILTTETSARELGEYAARVALQILAGADPGNFPIIINREWNFGINDILSRKAGIDTPRDLAHKAERVK
jgi:ABC-type uncharacterized transport system substrate-binding protein